jgi:hypothetical protein
VTSEPAATADVFAQAAAALRDSARQHKRSESHHRRQARALQQRLDALRRICEENGIELHIDTAPAKEAQS